MFSPLADQLKDGYCSLHNKLYDGLKQQLTNRLFIESDRARSNTLPTILQTTIQIQFNTLLYTEQELRDAAINALKNSDNAVERALMGDDEADEGYWTYVPSHVEKYNR